MIDVETFTGAAHWASYFINGDASGLEPDELQLADAWLDGLGGFYPVSLAEDEDGETLEPRFTWSYGLHTGADVSGGSVVDYVCHRVREGG